MVREKRVGRRLGWNEKKRKRGLEWSDEWTGNDEDKNERENIDKRVSISHEKSLRMVVTNRLFQIISIFFLVIGVILSAVGITLIIVSSSTQCTPVITSTSTVLPTVCPPQECHSTMFGAQVPVADYPWDDELNDPTSDEFEILNNLVSKQIINALEGGTPSKMHMLISSDALVSYDVQVTRVIQNGTGVIAYTSGVAVSTAPVDDMPKVTDIQQTLTDQLPDTEVVVNEPAYECPSPDCSLCPSLIMTTECPSISCPTTSLPDDCPTSTECPVCPPEVIPTECPSFTCPPSTPSTDCPHCQECPTVTECPIQSTTDCPTVIPTECPVCPTEGVPTECPLVTCPTSPPTQCPIATESPSTLPTDCPSQDCSSCPAITTECPSYTPSNTTECPIVSTVIPSECPTVTSDPTPDCSTCPPQFITTECPSTPCPTIIPSECPVVTTTECPSLSTTECPIVTPSDCPPPDCSPCPSEVIPTECPSSPSPSPSDCPSFNTTDCPSITPSDCPFDCTQCTTSGITTDSSSTFPPITPSDCPICPSTESLPSTECPSTASPSTLECHSTLFGAQVSLVETVWDPNLEDPESDEFKDIADNVSKMIINALEGSTNGMIILSSGDAKVTYNVQVDRFSQGKEGTIAYTSGVALSLADLMPTVSDIRGTLNSTLGEDTVIVENNELEFCASYLFPPPSDVSTTFSMGTTEQQTTQSTIHLSTTQETETTQSTPSIPKSSTQKSTHPSTSFPQSTSQPSDTTQTTPMDVQTTTEKLETTVPSTRLLRSTSQSPDTTPSDEQSSTVEWESTEASTSIPRTSSLKTETSQSTSPVPSTAQSYTTQPSITASQSTSHEPDTTQSESTEGTEPSTPSIQSTSQEPETTPKFDESTTEEPETTTTQQVSQSSTQEHGITHSTSSSYRSTSQESENTHSTTQQIPHSSTQQNEHTESTSQVPQTTQPSTAQSTTQQDFTTEVSSSSPSQRSTTEESGRSSTQSSTSSDDQSSTLFSTPLSSSSSESHSTDSVQTRTSSLSSTEESVHSSTSSLSTQPIPSSTQGESSTTLPSQTTTEQSQVTTESLTTLLSTLPSTSQSWTSPSTVSCSGREVINGDVYLLFDYTLYDGVEDETNGIEDFITDILFSFDGNHFFLGRDSTTGMQPLRFFLVHYPTDDENPYSTLLAKDITSLDQLKSVMDLIKQLPMASDSKMKEALEAIYAVSNTNNPQSIVLISKSVDFVDEATTIANQLQKDKKFNILGIPLNGVDLTPLTNYADIPLDVTSADSQVQTATDIDSILMSISSACLPSTPPPLTTTARYTTPSTTKLTTTTSSTSCASSLDGQSIAFVYQANGGVGDNPTMNSDIVNNVLNSDSMKQSPITSFGAVFPFPNTDVSYSSSAAHTWITLNDQRWGVFFNILKPSDTEIGANIADGLQSLLDNPDPNDVVNNIVVIIANSADEVPAAEVLADQLKETSTIITLSYGGDFDLSSLATSQQFVLTQTTEDSTEAASLLLNSILQATCQ